jgi:DNA (cytosine-5)-methyltransferase 1
MTIGSLFSGVGGLELGLEQAGLGPVLWQCELSPECRQVLQQHWPNATRFDDVKTISAAKLATVDVICGGFPCQDVSSAGKRAGLQAARSGLWFEYLRVVSELSPRWVVVENVASGADLWLATVAHGLESRGYAVLPVPLSAADVGAPHERARVFVLGRSASPANDNGLSIGAPTNASGPRLPPGRARSTVAIHTTHSVWGAMPSEVLRVDDGLPSRLDIRNLNRRVKALGNAVVPRCAEVIGHVIRQIEGLE